ncbi:MAG: multidrug resistance transporter, superfamily protein, partial [Solirubrobacterales bacterium]|nr:multidrug resistance transporter, superfamily protein [Solirubrobacterales bacterium]
GLAIFSAVATSRTSHLIAAHTAVPQALTSGFQRALTVGSVFLLASAVIALKATNTRGETAEGDGHSSSGAAPTAEPALNAA